METIITIKSMTKHYPMGSGKFTALKDINLEFGRGEFAGLIGASGSGKTTLLNILGTLDVQSEGEVTVLDHETEPEPEGSGQAPLRKDRVHLSDL